MAIVAIDSSSTFRNLSLRQNVLKWSFQSIRNIPSQKLAKNIVLTYLGSEIDRTNSLGQCLSKPFAKVYIDHNMPGLEALEPVLYDFGQRRVVRSALQWGLSVKPDRDMRLRPFWGRFEFVMALLNATEAYRPKRWITLTWTCDSKLKRIQVLQNHQHISRKRLKSRCLNSTKVYNVLKHFTISCVAMCLPG